MWIDWDEPEDDWDETACVEWVQAYLRTDEADVIRTIRGRLTTFGPDSIKAMEIELADDLQAYTDQAAALSMGRLLDIIDDEVMREEWS